VTTGLNLAAIGDLHVTRKSAGVWQPIFAQANAHADVLLLAGDLTDYGLPEEAHILATELSRTVKIPIIGVLGNHDYESGKHQEVGAILSDAGVTLLDGDTVEVGEVGFVGVKGFCGGFGRRTLEPWGEGMIKQFVQEAVHETMKLESGLARLRTAHRVALLHYAPVEGTVEGEPLEIFPFLGSSRLEEPLNRYAVAAAFHGHAHRGALEARTREGIPVYNVAAPLLRRTHPDAPPFRIVSIPAGAPGPVSS
jgi:Icc-related predicted phosphoesterase